MIFSTANRMKTSEDVWRPVILNEDRLEPVFRAVTETVEEAIIRSMLEAETVTGRDGNTRRSLSEVL